MRLLLGGTEKQITKNNKMKNWLNKYPFLIVLISILAAVGSIVVVNLVLSLFIHNQRAMDCLTAISIIPVGGFAIIYVTGKLKQ